MSDYKPLNRHQIAWRTAQDIEDGAYVNLGVGMPMAIPQYLPDGREIVLHSENGLLGMGPSPAKEDEDWDLINAGTRPTTLLPGGSFFHHADSFSIVRGGHLDISVLGAFQISEKGDLANWSLGPDATRTPTVGGAMDLAVGAKQVFVMTDHSAKDGAPKIVENCTLPLTGLGCVDRIYTDLAIIDVTKNGLIVREIVDGCGFEEIQEKTGAALRLADDCQILSAPDLGEDGIK
ncbi:MAG: 3-oxoacid CoA-transferase subunit B [Rhodospirillales bacterium]|nr:3-oxoacid CoA-transferase subunit B [Rhodospirillales bacterium]